MIRIPDKQKDWSDWKGPLSPEVWNDLYNSIRDDLDNTNWDYVFRHVSMTEDFIREFQDYFDYEGWMLICERQELSEKFLEEFKYKIDWNKISTYQKLSVPFIERYKEWVNWNNIFRFQKFNTIEWDYLKRLKNVHIDEYGIIQFLK